MAKKSSAVKALQTFMLENYKGVFLPRFKPGRSVKIDKWTLHTVFEVMTKRLDAGDLEGAMALLVHLDLFEEFLTFKDRRSEHLPNLLNAFEKERMDKAKVHLQRLVKCVPITAADEDYPDGARVAVVRTEHGWFDGRVCGTIVPGSGGFAVETDGEDDYYPKGVILDIQHLRDIRLRR